MRICLYTATALPKLGGQEHVVDALARELVKRQHEVTVLAPRPRRPLVAADSGLPYRMVRHPRFVSTRYFVGWYRRYLRACGPFDIVHAHDVYPTGWIAVQAGVGPVVITSHGGDLNAGNVRIVKPGVEARCVEALERASGLISIGRFTEGNFRRLTGRLPPLVTIPNGVYLESFSAGPSERPAEVRPGERFFLFLGRLHPRKGVDVLLRAMAGVQESAGLLVAGDGDERGALERLAREAGVADRVRFLGRRTGGDKAWLLANCLAVVMPSRGWEAFPLVVLEAAASGKAVVASRVPGLEDLVTDGETGRLVEPEDAAGLARALDEVGSRGEQWGEAARSRVGRYAWEQVVAEHEALYRTVAR